MLTRPSLIAAKLPRRFSDSITRMDSFFIKESNDLFIPTEFSRGPWDMRFQHGGPPAALLGRAVDRDDDKQVAQISLDILRPVPVTPLTVKTNVVRPGKRVELIEAALISEGHPVMRAKAWRVRKAEIDLDSNERPTPHPGPDEGHAPSALLHGEPTRTTTCTRWSGASSTSEFLQPGPADRVAPDEDPSSRRRGAVSPGARPDGGRLRQRGLLRAGPVEVAIHQS